MTVNDIVIIIGRHQKWPNLKHRSNLSYIYGEGVEYFTAFGPDIWPNQLPRL